MAPPDDHYRRFRVPEADGAALFVPDFDALPARIAANQQQIAAFDLDANGRSLRDLAAAARRRLVTVATQYTRAFCDVAPSDATTLLLSGHQPELSHPGVWMKNLALDRLAKRVGGLGVHLLIDSDLCRATSVRVPTGPIDQPRVASVAYDLAEPDTPYEERRVADRTTFDRFADRVRETIGAFVPEPLVATMWPDAVEAADTGAGLGAALSCARRLVEQRWGSATLELPLGTLCDYEEMQWALAWLLARLPELQRAHNGALDDYRLAHRLRSPAQPAPDLAQHDDWLEAPLWVWTRDDPTRRPLFARRTPMGLALSNRAGGEWSLDASPDEPLHGAVEQLADLRTAGVKLRPRALMTTLLARLLLGDLFLHGIGGAKYDQVTDDLCRRWLGFAPPPHATLTATLRLPIAHEPAPPGEVARLRRRLRELEFHPERFLESPSSDALAAIQRKQDAIGVSKTLANAAGRHQQIASANAALAPMVADERAATEAALLDAEARQRSAIVLDSREYSFCLFSEEDLRERLASLLE